MRNSSSRDDDPTDGVASCFARVSVQGDEARAEDGIKEEVLPTFHFSKVVSSLIASSMPLRPSLVLERGLGEGESCLQCICVLRDVYEEEERKRMRDAFSVEGWIVWCRCCFERTGNGGHFGWLL